MRLVTAGALLWAALASSAWAASDSSAARAYEDALTRYEKRDLSGAIVQLKTALQADSKLLAAHVLLGKALLSTGDVGAAEVAFAEALRLGVNRAEVVVWLARTAEAQGKQRELIDSPRYQLAGLPASTQAQLLLIKAGAHSDLGDPRSALKAIEDARAIDPGSADGWLAEVPVRIRARQFTEALVAVEKARAIDANSAEMHYQHGAVLHVQGNLPGALAAYDKALLANPDHVDARVARAGIALDLKRHADAAADIGYLTSKRPNEPRGWYLGAVLAEREGKAQAVKAALLRITALMDPVPIDYIRYRPQLLLLNGQAHYGLGQNEKAKPLFELFQRAQPGSPVSKLLANIYILEGNHDRAVDALEQYLRAFPNDSQAMALLAGAHMARGRHTRAAALMQQALQTKDAPELYAAYGLSLLGAGRGGDALSQLETAYKKDPGQTQAAVALVGLYLRSNQLPKALTVAQALVSRQPSNASYHNLLGIVRAQAGDAAGTRKAFEQALLLDPGFVQATVNLARLEGAANKLARAQELLDAAAKADERNTEVMYEQATLAERRGDGAAALRWLQKAFDVAGVKDMRASLGLVDLHMRQGRREEALKLAQLVASNLPDDLRVLVALARVQLANGDATSARTTLTNATRVAAFDAPVQTEIALLQMAARNLPGAAYSLEKALQADADHMPALVLLAEVDTRQGEFSKAEARVQQIIKKQPKQAIGQSLLGDLATARKQPAAALEAYGRAHQLQPSPDTFSRLFRTLANQDSKAALALAEPWLKAHPNDATSQRLLAETQVRSGNLPAARLAFERLRQMQPNNALVINDLAVVLLQLNDPQALTVAEQALQLQPSSPVLLDTVGWVAFKSGKLDRAVQVLRDARLRQPDSAELRYHLGAALASSGRKTEARDELEAALRDKTPFDGRSDADALLRSLKQGGN